MTKKISQMNKEELVNVANTFFIEVPEGATNNEIKALIASENITDEELANVDIVVAKPAEEEVVVSAEDGVLTTSQIQANKVEPTPVLTVDPNAQVATANENVLLRYDRQNPSFQIKTYKFSHQHPFQVVTAEDADYIVKNIPGFRPALQSEVKDFYA